LFEDGRGGLFAPALEARQVEEQLDVADHGIAIHLLGSVPHSLVEGDEQREVRAARDRRPAEAARDRSRIRGHIGKPALRASAKMANATVGSARAATVIARLDPMPPKGEPGSSPARERKNVPSNSRYTTTSKSPMPSNGSGAATIGTRNVTVTTLANTMNGVT